MTYSVRFDGKDLQLLSPGEKGIVLLLLYLEAESEDNRPLIIDQPDDNLDNLSVYPSLIDGIRECLIGSACRPIAQFENVILTEHSGTPQSCCCRSR